MTLEKLVEAALLEDLPFGDMTTDALECDLINGSAILIAKQDLILSGRDAFSETFRQVDSKTKIKWHFKNGEIVKNKSVICEIKGPLSSLLKAERTALNFLGHLSGVATLTSRFVAKTFKTKTKITDTRKTLPGFRVLEKQAVKDGGGVNHRMGLSDAILIKENHIKAAGNITKAVKKMRLKWPKTPIEVEVTNESEINEALKLKVERLLLDNMSLKDMAAAAKKIANRCIIEASGNMTLDRIESVAKLGVNFISVGALTHSAPGVDVSLLFKTEKP
jgi:nicotinate-nucleotide pyrophosphorylase (carboxylating)